MTGRVLVIAGSDPSGGAGIQADIKTITTLGGFAAAAVTALTVQNTKGVFDVRQLDAAFIRDQIVAVLSDIGADVIKIGMIGDVAAAEAIAKTLKREAPGVPLVLDPVLVATSGDALAGTGMVDAMKAHLIPFAALVTPNADEAAALTGLTIDGPDDLVAAGEALCAAGAAAALVKGGHLDGGAVTDVLVEKTSVTRFENPRLATSSTHGTGCTLASAVAAHLSLGFDRKEAVGRSIAYVRSAIEAAPGLGAGAGPLNHTPHGPDWTNDPDKAS